MNSDRVSRIDWVIRQCHLLNAIGDEFERTRPFDGLTIGTGIHLEAKGVALMLTLRRGGARVISTGNLNSTQVGAVDYLNAHGVEAIGGPTQDVAERTGWIDEILDEKPDLILDNGGDMFVRWLQRPYDGLKGGTEETTSGRILLAPLRDRLKMPILVINDSPIKQFAENRHAVGQSTIESFMRLTNMATNGRRVVVLGYGGVGKGLAINFRNNHARVSVLELDPVLRMEALWDGFAVPEREAALAEADIVLTSTAATGVIGPRDLAILRDGAILANVGHLPVEIDVPGMLASPLVAGNEPADDGITTISLSDGRSIHLLTDGHMVNLAGPRPLGNSIESMDIGFSLQARCLEAVARGDVGPESCVVPVPRAVDESVARDYVALATA
ncbi:MAG TPA: adenosylhomocysteinase [Candidatus Limnocylindria bacterium]|nr:adenosylhomocysteinase [Candidatus Limnocylindria bacterium]